MDRQRMQFGPDFVKGTGFIDLTGGPNSFFAITPKVFGAIGALVRAWRIAAQRNHSEAAPAGGAAPADAARWAPDVTAINGLAGGVALSRHAHGFGPGKRA